MAYTGHEKNRISGLFRNKYLGFRNYKFLHYSQTRALLSSLDKEFKNYKFLHYSNTLKHDFKLNGIRCWFGTINFYTLKKHSQTGLVGYFDFYTALKHPQTTNQLLSYLYYVRFFLKQRFSIREIIYAKNTYNNMEIHQRKQPLH